MHFNSFQAGVQHGWLWLSLGSTIFSQNSAIAEKMADFWLKMAEGSISVTFQTQQFFQIQPCSAKIRLYLPIQPFSANCLKIC